jgi:tartrate-resistant acid phosphatase type 5
VRRQTLTLVISCCLGWAGAACRCADSPKPFVQTKPSAVADEAGGKDAGPALRFVAVGDTGKGNDGQYQVGATIGALCEKQGCDFVALLGDNFYPSGVSSADDAQWQTAFEKPYASVKAPFYAVLGNHDYGGDGIGWELPKAQAELDYAKLHSNFVLPDFHYRFQKGEVDFFVADTNRSMFSVDDDMRQHFATWLPESTATWKIVLAHHPYLSNGRHGNAGSYDGVPLIQLGHGVKEFVEAEVCGLADLYIDGHDHELEWIQSTCTREGSSINTEFVVSGAGATTTGFQSAALNAYYWHSEQIGFVYFVIAGRTLTGTFFDASGHELFSRTLRK